MKDSLSEFLEKISFSENHDPRNLIKNKVPLDLKIKNSILKINDSGWCWTLFCCQGHFKGKQKGAIPYIVFVVKNQYKFFLMEKIFSSMPCEVNSRYPLMNRYSLEISPGFSDEKYSVITAYWHCNLALRDLQLVHQSIIMLGDSIVKENYG